MAVSAFKSTSRRGTQSSSSSSSSAKANRGSSDASQRKVAPRRSRSVSAFSRDSSSSSPSSVFADFLNKRDNPLFCTSDSPPPESETLSKKLAPHSGNNGGNFSNVKSRIVGSGTSRSSACVGEERRGRSITRNAGGVGSNSSGSGKDGGGRSLSRVDSRRRVRSVSRNPVSRGHFASSESDLEQEHHNWPLQNKTSSSCDVLDLQRELRTWSSQHPGFMPHDDSATSLTCSHFSNWEDGGSVGSLSGVEEKTIKAVSEQMKSIGGDYSESEATPSSIYEAVRSEVKRAISDIQSDLESAVRRSNSTCIVGSNVADIPPDLVNPGAVELVLDIRQEYAKKLEESEERARKLRADLAVEEHRGQELSRILKEILPDPRASSQKSRPGRKTSIERRKMSKRLTEEAMAYFDECVSLSTFDSSDFSSPEDPPLKLVGDENPARESGSLPASSLNVAAIWSPSGHISEKELSYMEGQYRPGFESSRLAAGSNNNSYTPEPGSSQSTSTGPGSRYKFSFSGNSNGYMDLQQDISKYVKSSKSPSRKDEHGMACLKAGCFDADEYSLYASMQSLMFDRVTYRNRLESGNLLICGGGVSISFSPFGSFI